ncbi:CocE/NonD family hydrolase [Amylibacter sp. IMCC11727]|uniref:CocE/NonD family hydrolase n=1 Tax=Amylibacter sp. IMCC11727 TaxID=3039851 RepID=UPI00244DCB2C|nr:CocE/NonD family hydrolase [Amylibacter sp. IMCC11727]WGI20917.1 CocE/NonD family hydrolase [Amylibacter sp. IMCC11727]
MQIVTEFPFDVVEEADLRIPLSDGVELSARVWFPVGAGPVPVVLEYLPYRKRDGTAARDAGTHPYLAGHGYVCVRVDMRGCGESEGLFEDEYSPQELADGVEVVNWLSAQEWCSGAVGMMGISWGGFNSLQIAALAPEPLKAVISLCSTVDRFADDIHYKGGVMLGENPGWAATALSWFSVPPDPELVGDGWRDIWLERLENTPFLAERWVSRQVRDDYWAHGSVCEDYSSIKAAVLTVGGWHDGYRNTPAHLVENLDAPVKGIVGPWNHKYPHIGVPGPQIDFLGEMLRWWDHWLKGIDRGVDRDPAYRAYVMDSVAPEVSFETRTGRWVGLDQANGSGVRAWAFTGEGLADVAGDVDRSVGTDVACGQGTGEYFPFGFGPGELPDDQQGDDAKSMCFDSAALREELEIVGACTVAMTLASDQPRAQVAVRLTDLRPDGTSALIAHGFLNLRHRDGHDRVVDMPVGEAVNVEVVLDQAAYRLPAGHRLRVAISPSYFPFVWPEEEPVTLTVTAGALRVPVLDGEGVDVAFDPAKGAVPIDFKRFTQRVESKNVTLDGDVWRQEIIGDDGLIENPKTGLKTAQKVHEVFEITEGDPRSARAKFAWERSYGRGDWMVHTKSHVALSSEDGVFVVAAKLEAFEGDEPLFERDWRAVVPKV